MKLSTPVINDHNPPSPKVCVCVLVLLRRLKKTTVLLSLSFLSVLVSQPWFAEMGNNCPSILPQSDRQALETMAIEAATKAMGLQNGVLHCELKNTSRGPRLVEVNPRMGGGPVWSLHKLAFGVDFVEETLYAALNIPGSPVIPKSPKLCLSCGEKFFENSMVVPKEFCKVNYYYVCVCSKSMSRRTFSVYTASSCVTIALFIVIYTSAWNIFYGVDTHSSINLPFCSTPYEISQLVNVNNSLWNFTTHIEL